VSGSTGVSITVAGPDEFLQLLLSKGRRVYVTEKAIHLNNLKEVNRVFVLQLPEQSTAAGGRGGGLGERRIVKVYRFEFGNGECRKIGEIEGDERLDMIELPYHATATPVILPNGSEKLVSGVVDPDFVASYAQALS
jgi:hypothetical protein